MPYKYSVSDGFRWATRHTTYQKQVNTHRDLPLWPRDHNFVTRLLGVGEGDLAIAPLLNVFNLRQTGKQFSMVEAVDVNDLGGELLILDVTINQPMLP